VAKDLAAAGMMPDAVKAYMKNMFGATDDQIKATLAASEASSAQHIKDIVDAGAVLDPNGSGGYQYTEPNTGNVYNYDSKGNYVGVEAAYDTNGNSYDPNSDVYNALPDEPALPDEE
jgi:hypothetical protein